MYILNSLSVSARHSVAIGIFAVCLGIRLLIFPVEDGHAFLTFYPGTAITALFCGLAPSLLYIFLAAIFGSYIFVTPYWSFEQSSYLPLVAFFIAATTILLVIDFFQRRVAQQKKSLIEESVARQQLVINLQQHREQLVSANEELVIRQTELADSQRIANVGSWSWNTQTDEIVASPEMCRIFAMTSIPSFAEQDGLMFPHQAWLQLQKARQEVIRTGVGYNLELPALRADGSQFWVNSRSELVRDANGKNIGLRGMVQDITERKQSESIAKSERFIKTITDAMPALIAYFDNELRCRFANKAYLDWHGRSAEVMRGATLKELLGESLFAVNKPYIDGALAGENQQFERYLTKHDGSVGYVLANYIPDTDTYGNIAGFILLVTDIKGLKLAEAEHQLASTIFDNTVEGIMVTDADGIILSVNPAFTEITGYPAQEAVGQTPRLLRSHHHDEAFHSAVWGQLAEQGQWKGEIWNRRKNGEVFLEWQTITRIGGEDKESIRYIAVFHDITEAWQKNEKNRHLAFHDALTNLPNRALLLERLERHIIQAGRQRHCLALMFLDLDRFKLVNDTLGHAIGDELLISVAHKLQELVRQTDTVARLGGDEFVVLLDNPANKDEVLHIASRIIAVINEPMAFSGKAAHVGTSVGIAMFPSDGTSALELLKNADNAMYQAKRVGRNTYRFFELEVSDDVGASE